MAPRPRAPRPTRPAHRDRTPWQRVWDRVRAADPGWDRARTSARAVLGAGLGAAAAAGVAMLTDQPVRLAALAAVVGIFGGITLPPPVQRARHLPAVAVVFTTSALVTTVLTPWPLAARGALLAAIALGAWAGRWGQRGVALGLLAFLGSFFSLLFDATPEGAPAVVAAGLLGTLGLALAERWLLPDRPAVLLRRLVRSLVSQASLMVDAAEALVGEGPGSGRQRRVRRRLLAVQEVALLVDTILEDPAAERSVANPDELRSDVLVVEALADHLVWVVLSVAPDAPPAQRAELVAAMRRARVPMDVDVHRAVDPLVPQLVGQGDDRVVEVLERLAAAVERLVHAARPTGARAPGTRATTAPPPPAAATPISRTVVQATLSGVLALALGTAIDPDQWFWAVVGAYIVVTTTSSRGTALRKAADRVVGTGLGVVAGLGVGSLLAGRATIGLVALLGLLFATFWVFRINYRWMMFLLTVTVAVLYELTGRLSVEVLALRLAETALGALVAGLVVFFVLPTPTRRTVDGAVDALLGALDDLLAAVAEGRAHPADVRAVDTAVSALRTTTAPLVTQAPTRIGGEVRAARLLATAVRVRAGALATAVASAGAPRPGEPDHDALAIVRDHCGRLRRHLDDPAAGAPADPAPFPSCDGAVGRVLQAIDDRLAGYGTARGLALRPDPGALAGGTPRWRD